MRNLWGSIVDSVPFRRILQIRLEDADTGQMPVALCKVEAVTHYKFIGNDETDKVSGEFHAPTPFLIEQHAGFDTVCS